MRRYRPLGVSITDFVYKRAVYIGKGIEYAREALTIS
jgi:hypothetical protein